MPRRPLLPILLAIACALWLRALVPAGWMPAPGGGAFAIEPCPAAGPQPIMRMAAHHSGHSHGAHQSQHDGDCSFSPLHSAFAQADFSADPGVPLLTSAAAMAPPAVTPFKTGPPSPPPPATGPPALA